MDYSLEYLPNTEPTQGSSKSNTVNPHNLPPPPTPPKKQQYDYEYNTREDEYSAAQQTRNTPMSNYPPIPEYTNRQKQKKNEALQSPQSTHIIQIEEGLNTRSALVYVPVFDEEGNLEITSNKNKSRNLFHNYCPTHTADTEEFFVTAVPRNRENGEDVVCVFYLSCRCIYYY